MTERSPLVFGGEVAPIMNPTNPFPGYGYSFEGRQAAWDRIESGLPPRGPGCPFVLDLLDHMRGELSESAAEPLSRHVAGCPACQARLESLRRGQERLATLIRTEGPTLGEELAAEFEEDMARLLAGKPEVFPVPGAQTALKIVPYPHPALRYKARPLTAIDGRVRRWAEEMLELMHAHHGLGLAATQVALPFQIFVLNAEHLRASQPDAPELPAVYINPVIVEAQGTTGGEEGCLSFPNLFHKVRRKKHVTVRAYDLAGRLVEVEASDLAARVLQHEIDHLHGELFIDKLGTIGRLAARSALGDFEREFARARERGEVPPDALIIQQMDDLARLL
jgi:peptide deformylase